MKARVAGTAVVAILGLPWLPASPAAAGGELTYTATKSVEAAPGSTRTVKVACPAGTHVLGGGGFVFGGEVEYGSALIAHEYPYDGNDGDSRRDDGWKAQGSAFDAFVTFDVRAVCAPVLPRYKRLSIEVDPMTALTSVDVPCGGLPVVSGGSQGATAVRQTDGHPVDRGASGDSWDLGFDNVSDEVRTVTGFAICSDDIGVTYAQTGPFTVPPRDQLGASAQCPPAARNVVGGGQLNGGAPFEAAHIVQDALSRFVPSTQDIWSATLDNDGASSFIFSVYASCAPDL